MHCSNPNLSPSRKILILGGGFAGIYTALHLEKLLRQRPDVDITLVNRDNFFLFTPMLHEVAASDVDLTNIVSPIRKLLRRTHFFQGDVASLDLTASTATLVHGSDGHSHTARYDYLVLALGSVTNFYNLPGVAEHCLTMKTLGDAIRLRNLTIARLEEADTECAAGDRDRLLTFVVVGGGFAGVETIGALNDFARDSLRFYPSIRPEQVRMVLVHPGQTILPELGPELGAYAQGKLASAHVEVLGQQKVTVVDGQGVYLSDGTHIPSATVVWTAGNAPHPLCATLPYPSKSGRITVSEQLQVPSYPHIFALGDCALVPDPRTQSFHPPTAQHAIRQARIAARNLVALMDGRPTEPFTFKTLGALAAIGRRAGVAKVMGLKFSGFPAWFLWRTIYLAKLPRFEKKLRVALDWTLDLFFSKDLVQYLHAERNPAPTPVIERATR